MGWENDLFALFDDLEQQAGALYAAERDAEVADRSRAEYQQVTLAGRLMASLGGDVVAGIAGVGTVSGRLERVADGWALLASGDQDWIVRAGGGEHHGGCLGAGHPRGRLVAPGAPRPGVSAAAPRRGGGALRGAPARRRTLRRHGAPGSAGTSASW